MSHPQNEEPNVKPSRMIAERYEILSELGAGGMGVVYKAKDSMLKNFVAVKMLRAHDLTPEEFLRFQIEAKAAGNLNHPNIVTIYTFGMDGNLPYMIMEYFEGTSLSAYIKQHGPLSLPEAMPIFAQICDGMTHAHRKGVLHRDLKSSNILLIKKESGELQVKILDFGIAKIEGDEGNVTKTGLILGSPRYMSPEQFAGSKVDVRSDVYSMGCIIFETLTGKTPYEAENILMLKQMHETSPVPDPKDVCPEREFSDALKVVLRKVLAKTPANRYQKMDHLKAALLSALNNPNSTSGEFRLGVLSPFNTGSKTPLILAITIFVAVLTPLIFLRAPADVPKVESRDRQYSDGVGNLKELTKKEAESYWFPAKVHHNDSKTDDEIKRLKPNAEGVLDLSSSSATDSVMDSLPANLKGVFLDATQVSDVAVGKLVKRCKGLKRLHLLACDNITDRTIDILDALPMLEDLELSSAKITPSGIGKLAKFKKLTDLSLEGCKSVTDDGARAIAKLKKLRNLYLRGTKMTAAGIANFQGLHLRILDISALGLTDDDIAKFKNLDVADLNVSQNQLTPKALDYFAQFPSLTHINLNRTPTISIEEIEAFEKRTRIRVTREEM